MLKMFKKFLYLHVLIWIYLNLCLSAWLVRYSNVRLMIVGAFTTLNVLLNCSTRKANSRPHFSLSKLQPEKNSLVLFMNVLCAREWRTRIIGTCNLQYADAAQLHTTGSACQGFPSYSCPFLVMFYWWKQDFLFLTVHTFFPVTSPLKRRKVPMATCKGRGMSGRDQMDMLFLVIVFWSTARVFICAPCFRLAIVISYHSRFIVFVEIFCRKHEIIKKLGTPKRNHIIFPDVKKLRVPKRLVDPPNEKGIPEEEVLKNASPEPSQSPPAVASDQNQCSCSGPFDSFAPESLFRHPYPGTCGWLGDWPSGIPHPPLLINLTVICSLQSACKWVACACFRLPVLSVGLVWKVSVTSCGTRLP